MREMTEEVFLKDVANHQMTALMDNGIYRHLKFKNTIKPTWNQWFELITWPGTLCYNGDMGCYVFSRLEDMFEFFRDKGTGPLRINTGYWAEKLEAVDRSGSRQASAKIYNQQIFIDRVNEVLKEWTKDEELTKEEVEELRYEVDNQLLRYADSGEMVAHIKLGEFSCELSTGKKYELCDTWEWDLTEYSFHFIWCCYALVWAIRQYDKVNQPVEESVVI